MPTYDYHCANCNRNFTVRQSITDHGKTKAVCPKCKGKKVKQLITAFTVKTSRKS